jgi:hypothetical protein
VGICGDNNVSAGQNVTLTTSVLDERRQIFVDIPTVVTATVYSTPTLGFSTTVGLSYCSGCQRYQQVVALPHNVPIGRYIVEYSATHPDYLSAAAISAFFVRPDLTTTLDIFPTELRSTELMTLTAKVYDRGGRIMEAGVYAEIDTPGGSAKIPLLRNGDVYQTTLRPGDLADILEAPVLPGRWSIKVVADYQGGTAIAIQQVNMLHDVYLPLVVRQW